MKDTKDIEKRTGLPISELVRLRLMGYKVTVEKDKPTTIDDIVKEMVASNGKQMKFAVIGHCYRKG